MKTQVYDVKINKKWSKVRATSIKALSDWCKQNNAKDWRMVGMMSASETLLSQSFQVVA